MSGMRQLKWHEKKLLKKVDFLQWRQEKNLREVKVLRRYLIQDREDYTKYNKIVGMAKKLAHKLKKLPMDNEIRVQTTEALLQKLYTMGLITTTSSLSKVDGITVSAIARRRLPVVMVRLKMAENIKEAVKYVEQGHVRVGPEVTNDPAMLITRTMEDFVTWVDSSRIKRAVQSYNDQLDDYDLLGE